MMRKLAILFGIALLSAGCSILPNVGPSSHDVVSQQGDDLERRYEIIDITPPVVDALRRRSADSFRARFGDYRASVEPRIGVGDIVAVTIWEAGAGGLFSAPLVTEKFSAGSKSATIPEQVVGRDGSITVPYAGRVVVAGQTTQDVQRIIEEQLAGKAIQPQVLLTVTKPISNAVTVTGEVTAGARVPLTIKGDKLLDVIASVGGVRAPVNETFVRLSRGNVTVSVPLNAVINNPRENIYMRPNDVLTLVRDPQTFIAYGATGRNAEVPFDAEGITLSQALAKSGGLLDFRADPAGVFLFRFEPASIVRELRPESPLLATARYVPVVYRLDMRDANSLFVAQAMRVHNKDVLYVSNSPLANLEKVLSVFNTVTSPINTGAGYFTTFR